eukprot:10168423-Karenia_brevis.AAC.1
MSESDEGDGPVYLLAQDFEEAMATYKSDVDTRTTQLVKSLHDTCSRQFGALDKRVSKVERAMEQTQAE